MHIYIYIYAYHYLNILSIEYIYIHMHIYSIIIEELADIFLTTIALFLGLISLRAKRVFSNKPSAEISRDQRKIRVLSSLVDLSQDDSPRPVNTIPLVARSFNTSHPQ